MPDAAYTSVKPTATWPRSRWSARTNARPDSERLLGARASRGRSAIALLLPRIGMVVIAARFPIAGLIGRTESNAIEPLRALPKIEIRHERAHRRTMRARERGAVELVRDEHVRERCLVVTHVRRIAVRGFEDDGS